MATAKPRFAYRAFLSYSHAADGALAPALQSALHRFGKPWYRLRAMRVFRDKTSLAMTPELWPALEAALGESDWFLLMASPESACSDWVRKEVCWWLANRTPSTLLVLLTDGSVAWDEPARDFDWTRTTALPRDLTGRFVDVPGYVDLRWARTAEKLSLRHARFREAVLDIAAPLLRRSKDELDGEDIREHRRTRTAAWAAVTAIVIFALAAAWEAYTANQRYHQAFSRQLAAQSINALPTQLDRSLLLAVAASQIDNTVEAQSSLLHALEFAPLLRTFLWSESDAVYGLAFSRRTDGLMASVHKSGDVLLWEFPRGTARVARRMRGVVDPQSGHGFPLRCVALSPDGSLLATGDNSGDVIVWDTHSPGQPVSQDNNHSRRVNGLAFSADGRWLASAGDDQSVVVRRVGAWIDDAPRRMDFDHEVTSIGFQNDSSTIAVATGPGAIKIWDMRTNALQSLAGVAGKPIASLAFSPTDSTLLASGGAGQTPVLWDLRTLQPRREQPQPIVEDGEPLQMVAFSPDGRTLAGAGAGRTVFLWDTKTLIARTPLRGHSGTVFGLAFNADGSLLVSGDANGNILTWDLSPRSPLLQFSGEAWSVVFSADGRRLAAGAKDGTILVRDIASQQSIFLPGVHGQGVSGVAFTSVDGHRLASVGPDTTGIVEWDLAASPTHHVLDTKERHLRLAIAFDRNLLATATTDGYIVTWDTVRQRSVKLGPPHKGTVRSVSIERNSSRLASVDGLGFASVWDLAMGRRTREFWVGNEGVVVMFPDGQALASAVSSGAVALQDLADRRPIETLGYHGAAATSLAVSDDGALLASGDNDGNIILWDTRTRQQIGPALAVHTAVVGSLAFQPGSPARLLASASDDGTVRLWDLNVDSWRQRACRAAGRDLSQDERAQFLGGLDTLVICSPR